jgi:ATP-dependent helicase/nuclease subunit B
LENSSIFAKSGPKVFTIEPYHNFLRSLAKILVQEIMPDDGFASDAIILLPTRRAARILAQEFLEARENKAIILPRIRTLGDVDPEDINLSGLGSYIDFSPHISQQRKIFELARLIQKRDEAAGWSKDPNNAINAAEALADLLDSAQLMAVGDEGLDWSRLDDLVDDDLAEHWKKSRDFLKIITEYWPARLKELGLSDPAQKRRLSIESLAKSWDESPPNVPIIIAGSTGSIPAARELMRVVSHLPKGCVILPGLDKEMAQKDWGKIKTEDGHPQRILHDTINHIGINRDDVDYWPNHSGVNEDVKNRRALLNLALLPKEATADWILETQKIGAQSAKSAMSGLNLIEAPSEELEAQAIALYMRETLEHKNQTCALITPNQNIAHRVSEKMARWNIRLDLSSGTPFLKSDLGLFIELVSEFILCPPEPKSLMSLLAHPFAKLGMDFVDRKHGAIGLELGLLRGAARDESIGDILARANEFEKRDWDYKRAGKDKTLKLLGVLINVEKQISENLPQTLNLSEIAKYLLKACEIIATNEDKKSDYIWKREAGNVGASFFANLIKDGDCFEVNSLFDGFRIIKNLMANNVVRPMGTHPNLAILGPLEARLLHFDKYILAGLDDGIWPQAIKIDPFLSRPMRAKLGLQSKDLRLGLSAHDFAQLAANENVLITRAARRAGEPSVPSRWLWRLKTLLAGVLGEKQVDDALASYEFNALELSQKIMPNMKFKVSDFIPKPNPPLSARPLEFSATQIENLIRDPYKIYVTKVLELNPLDGLGGEISAKERGSAIHAALEIIKDWGFEPPKDAVELLIQEFGKQLLKFGYEEEMIPLELERLRPSAQLMVQFQSARAKDKFHLESEKRVNANLDIDGNIFNIKAFADRIDISPKGEAEIWDYKTGTPPTDKQISSFFAPQLPVTAWILTQQNDLSIKKITVFGHIKIGNKTPSIMEYSGKVSDDETIDIDECIKRTDKTLRKLLGRFHTFGTQYNSKPRVAFLYKNQSWEDLTDRLARRLEWADAAIDGGSDE